MFDGHGREGLTSQMATTIPSAITAAPSAAQVCAAASAAVAAQAIDENASAKVAMRDDVCRRRN